MDKNFCEAVRKTRKQKNLTLIELSELSGISNGQLSKIERGIHHPSRETIKKLSHALDVDEETLLNFAGYKPISVNYYNFSFEVRYNTLTKYKGTCQICGDKAPHSIIDVAHIIPQNYGGTDTADNLVTLCSKCNEAREKLIQKQGIKDDYLIKLFNVNIS
jgi:transcriptional regulator with XRE-family HTH domain